MADPRSSGRVHFQQSSSLSHDSLCHQRGVHGEGILLRNIFDESLINSFIQLWKAWLGVMGRARDTKVDANSNMELPFTSYFILNSYVHLFLVYMIGI